MKVAYLKAPLQVRYEDEPDPVPGYGQVLLRPKLVGLCGTDVQMARKLATEWTRFGHEPVAEVVALGEGVRDLRPGDLVACQTSSACGKCRACLMGRPHNCNIGRLDARFLGFLAELAVVDRRNMWKLSPAVSPRAAVLLEPMGMSFDLNLQADTGVGRSTVVVGPGPIGLMAIRIAHLRGARNIIVVGAAQDVDRFDLCHDLGASQCVDASSVDPVEAVLKSTDGDGADTVLNTATIASIHDSLRMCGFGGKVVFLGETTDLNHPRPTESVASGPAAVSIDANWIHYNRLTLQGSFAAPNGLLPLGHDLVAAGEFPQDRIVSHIFGFDELEHALRALVNREPGVIKVAIAVNE